MLSKWEGILRIVPVPLLYSLTFGRVVVVIVVVFIVFVGIVFVIFSFLREHPAGGIELLGQPPRPGFQGRSPWFASSFRTVITS